MAWTTRDLTLTGDARDLGGGNPLQMSVDNQMIDYRQGMDVGLGFNLSPAPTGATPRWWAESRRSKGPRAAHRHQVPDHHRGHQLHEFLGINVEAEGSYLGFSASAKVDYAEECDFSNFSTYVVIQVRVLTPSSRSANPSSPTRRGSLLTVGNTDAFRRRFGDCFISGRQLGGEYYAIYQFTSTSEAKKASLSAQVNAAWTSGLASAELHASIQHEQTSEHERVETHIYTYRDGTVREADIALGDILETARAFPVEVANGEAVPFSVMIDSYDLLKKPDDALDLFKIEQKREVLAELTRKLDRVQVPALRHVVHARPPGRLHERRRNHPSTGRLWRQ